MQLNKNGFDVTLATPAPPKPFSPYGDPFYGGGIPEDIMRSPLGLLFSAVTADPCLLSHREIPSYITPKENIVKCQIKIYQSSKL